MQNVKNPTDNRRHKVEAVEPTTTNIVAEDEGALTEDAADPALREDAQGIKYKQDPTLADNKWYKLNAEGEFEKGDRVDKDGDKVANDDDVLVSKDGDLKYYKLNAEGEFTYIDGFVLETYLDEDQQFIQDSFTQVKAETTMVPILGCNYPCASCLDISNRDWCTGCWYDIEDISLQRLMTYNSAPGECKAVCDAQFTTNRDPEKRCTPCDQSCDECYDLLDGFKDENGNPIIDEDQNPVTSRDAQDNSKLCKECSAEYPFRYQKSKVCLNTCNQGIFDPEASPDSPATSIYQ